MIIPTSSTTSPHRVLSEPVGVVLSKQHCNSGVLHNLANLGGTVPLGSLFSIRYVKSHQHMGLLELVVTGGTPSTPSYFKTQKVTDNSQITTLKSKLDEANATIKELRDQLKTVKTFTAKEAVAIESSIDTEDLF